MTNIAQILAHELGHSLGLKHDDKYDRDCKCDEAYTHCIMHPVGSANAHHWSECSRTWLETLATNSTIKKCQEAHRNPSIIYPLARSSLTWLWWILIVILTVILIASIFFAAREILKSKVRYRTVPGQSVKYSPIQGDKVSIA